MVARPYAIHSDSECDRLEKQAVLAGLENHLRHVPVPKTARILDAGCGSGAMARCFASHFADASVIGVDIRDDYVVYAQGRAKEDGLQNVDFRQGSVFKLPFANASFDVVWSKYVMQWINDPEKAVAEFRRVTKPGGVVVCCNFDGFAITHYPEDELLQRHILTVFPRLVDVNIGRKTAPIFHECGLINISVLFEPDSLFTTVGTIDPERRENWIVQLAAARPHIAKILGNDEAAREFCDAFVRYYERPDTSSYTALYFVRGQVPGLAGIDALEATGVMSCDRSERRFAAMQQYRGVRARAEIGRAASRPCGATRRLCRESGGSAEVRDLRLKRPNCNVLGFSCGARRAFMDDGYEAARVHYCSRRHDGRMVGRDTRPAADEEDRLPKCLFARPTCSFCGRVQRGT